MLLLKFAMNLNNYTFSKNQIKRAHTFYFSCRQFKIYFFILKYKKKHKGNIIIENNLVNIYKIKFSEKRLTRN